MPVDISKRKLFALDPLTLLKSHLACVCVCVCVCVYAYTCFSDKMLIHFPFSFLVSILNGYIAIENFHRIITVDSRQVVSLLTPPCF